MSNSLTLKGKTRSLVGGRSVKKVRRAGKVPGVIYGKKTAPKPIEVLETELMETLHHAASEQVLINLELEEESGTATHLTLVQEVQHNPITDAILHIDLHEVSQTEKITAHIPVVETGEATGVKNGGGRLEVVLRELEVECLPRDLPDKITLDVTNLAIGDSIHVRDVPIPEGVVITNDPELTVCSVAAPRVSGDDEEVPTEAAAEPEMLKEKKEEETAA
ncbi:MAG: 50S ribosomal protein L25 [Verrucomicrobiota bacterium]